MNLKTHQPVKTPKLLPVKVGVGPVEPLSLKVYGQSVGPAQLVASDLGDVGTVSEAAGDVRCLPGVPQPVRVVQEPGRTCMTVLIKMKTKL